MNEAQDDELVEAARAGDPQAAEALVRRYARRLGAFLYRLCGSVHDSEDLMQETFARFFAALDGYRSEGHFKTYLFRIASNLAANRAAAARQRDTHLDDAAELVDAAPGPFQQAAARQGADALRERIARLPAEQREALLLRTHEDMDYAEIARVQGASVSAVKVRVFRAREALRCEIEAEEVVR